MFFLVALLIWTAVHVYVFWRLGSAPGVARAPRWLRWAVAALLGWAYLLGRIADVTGYPRLAAALEIVGANWIGVLFLIFVCLLVADLVTGFGRLLPGPAPRLRAGALATAAVLAVIAFVQAARPPLVSSHQVQLAGLPAAADGTVVVVVSDLHLGTLRNQEWLAALVEQVNGQRPDLIVLAGDIVEGHSSQQHDFVPLLRRLSAPLGVWAVTGNHEFYGAAAGGRAMEQAGVRMLRDAWAEARPGLILAGVEDLTVRRSRLGTVAGFTEKALAGRPLGTATIFLSHSPWRAEAAAAQGAGLMLSGHTHNGQIWPFTYVVRLFYPLVSGRYQVGGMPVIVGRGTGTWGPRMRLWRRGEILRITLRAG